MKKTNRGSSKNSFEFSQQGTKARSVHIVHQLNEHPIKTKPNYKPPAVRDSLLTSLLICYEGQGTRGRNDLCLLQEEINLGSREMMYCRTVLATTAERKLPPSLVNNYKCLFKGNRYTCSAFPELYSWYVTKIQLFLWRAYWWAK